MFFLLFLMFKVFHSKYVKRREKRLMAVNIEFSSMASPTESPIPVVRCECVPSRVLGASLSCAGGVTAMKEPHGRPHDCGTCGA